MIIHVVQTGESTNEIAKKYGISEERLILDNEIQNPDNLAVGETLIILIPQVVRRHFIVGINYILSLPYLIPITTNISRDDTVGPAKQQLLVAL